MEVFEERGKPKYTKKNLSEQGREPTDPTCIIMMRSLVIEPRPYWWEASGLTMEPSLYLFQIINLI